MPMKKADDIGGGLERPEKNEMIREIEAKSILRKHKKIDSWFLGRYGMNLYRGCRHDCVYCDGRADRYQVEGNFGRDVTVKINAPIVLARELDPARKRTPLKKSYMIVGGGVGDAYQPAEKQYRLTRQALEMFYHHGFPVHILTKSTLVERDMDILKKIRDRSGAIISMSFSSLNRSVCEVFEPGISSPEKRWAVLRRFKEEGFACGLFYLPVIPLVSDSKEQMEEVVSAAADAKIDFIHFGGMTLKEGRQKDHFYRTLAEYDPSLPPVYDSIYRESKWGAPSPEYAANLYRLFHTLAVFYKVPMRAPLPLFNDIIDREDMVVVLLEQIDYFLKTLGQKSAFGFAAWSISQIKQPLASVSGELRAVRGIGPGVEKVILEILRTGTSTYHGNLLKKIYNGH